MIYRYQAIDLKTLYIQGFFRLLVIWVLPFLVLKIIREAVRVVYAPHHSWGQSVAILIALVVSWTYSITVYLSGCALFNLVCNFQVIHFENYGKLLERDLDITQYIEEHIRLTHYLSKISHRFRIFFILELLVVTASQIVAIFQTTWHSEILNLVNGGDFVVSEEQFVVSFSYLNYSILQKLVSCLIMFLPLSWSIICK